MLNLYLVPKHSKPVHFDEMFRKRVSDELTAMGIIGKSLSSNEYAPGLGVAHFFHTDAEQHVLPGELTFESLSFVTDARATFLPKAAEPGTFDDAKCPVCDDSVENRAIDLALEKLNFFPVTSVRYACPSCCVDIPFSELVFSQNVAVAHAWIFVEGVAFGRLNVSVVERLSKVIGFPLMIVPEIPEESIEEWAPSCRFPS